MLETLLIICIILGFAALCSSVSDWLTSEPVETYERKTRPFISRHLKPKEIAVLIKELNIIEGIHPITPASYHDDTQLGLEELISFRLGYKFQLSAQDWFHIFRAWYVTRGQEMNERIERLDLRLKLNI